MYAEDPTPSLRERFALGVDAPWSDGEFGRLALGVFRYQFEHNPVYRRFCEGRGRTPESVTEWGQVPAVPTRAFKHLDLVCGDPADVDATFLTSGTTGDGGPRGRHLVPELALYRASLLPPFETHVLGGGERGRFVSLIPSTTDVPDSSLSYMVHVVAEAFATEIEYVVDGAGDIGHERLEGALDRTSGPVVLLGTAFAFVHALDAGATLGPLPDGSRIMETGGFKGRAREVSRDELYGRLGDETGVPSGRIVNEYGMTELLSQLYASDAAGPGHVPPPWLRVRSLDPSTLAPMPEGENGLLAFYDLANAGSVAHVLTEDVGSIVDGRLHLAGRADGAEPRGCSRAMDELMSVAR